MALKREDLKDLLQSLGGLEEELERMAQTKSQNLMQSHQRVRAITNEGKVQVKPQLPMDILGVYVLKPGQRNQGSSQA